MVGPRSLGVCLLTAAFVGMVFTIQFIRWVALLAHKYPWYACASRPVVGGPFLATVAICFFAAAAGTAAKIVANHPIKSQCVRCAASGAAMLHPALKRAANPTCSLKRRFAFPGPAQPPLHTSFPVVQRIRKAGPDAVGRRCAGASTGARAYASRHIYHRRWPRGLRFCCRAGHNAGKFRVVVFESVQGVTQPALVLSPSSAQAYVQAHCNHGDVAPSVPPPAAASALLMVVPVQLLSCCCCYRRGHLQHAKEVYLRCPCVQGLSRPDCCRCWGQSLFGFVPSLIVSDATPLLPLTGV